MLTRRTGQRPAEGVTGRGDERGSVLILMPVAALIFVILGSLAVDATVVFLAERELANAAAAAANDAATRAIDLDVFYARGCIELVEELAQDVVAVSVASKQLGQDDFELGPPQVDARGREVTVTLTGQAPHIFSKALPGAPDVATVSATATATAEGLADAPGASSCAPPEG